MSHMTSQKGFIKVAAAALAIAAMSLFSAGCAPECVDKFDCSSKGKLGEQWTCVTGVCKQGSPDPTAGTADAGP